MTYFISFKSSLEESSQDGLCFGKKKWCPSGSCKKKRRKKRLLKFYDEWIISIILPAFDQELLHVSSVRQSYHRVQ
jgi:hypothetical protein